MVDGIMRGREQRNGDVRRTNWQYFSQNTNGIDNATVIEIERSSDEDIKVKPNDLDDYISVQCYYQEIH